MIMKANKQIGFIYKDNESIDKILKDGDVVFERGFLREKTSTTLPITFGGVGKDLKDYKIYGNTYQNSTSGKNLLGFGAPNAGKGTQTTYDKKTGLMTTVGTTLQSWPWVNEFNANIPAGTTLTISSNLQYQIYARLYYNDSEHYDIDNKTTKTRTLPRDIKRIVLLMNVPENTTIDETYYVQIEEGSVATEFEPYTGGQPSPNPDYPQEIISCGDRTKNLLNYTKWTNAYIGTNGVIYTDNSYKNALFEDYIEVKPNTKYTMSTKTTVNNIGVSEFDSSKTFIKRNQFAYDVSQGTIITTNDTRFIRISINYNGLSAITDSIINNLEPMFELSEIRTLYEPYGYKIPVNVRSDNLFDISEITSVANGTLSNNIITTNTSGSVANFNVSPIFPQKKLLSGHTYYLSADIRKKSGAGNFRKINDYVADWTSLISPTISDVFQKYVFTKTFTTDTAYYRFLFQFGNVNNAVFEIKNIMLSEVNEDYQPYYNETTNIYLDEPLRKIEEYSDYIDFINSKVVRNIDEIILNGSESWSKVGATRPNYMYFYSSLLDNLVIKNISKNIICNNFEVYEGQIVYNTSVNTDTINVSNSSSTQRLRILIAETRLPSYTTDNFKSWLQSNNVIVDYALATPTEESITLPNIPTVEGNNTLNIETEITPSQVYIKYKSNS